MKQARFGDLAVGQRFKQNLTAVAYDIKTEQRPTGNKLIYTNCTEDGGYINAKIAEDAIVYVEDGELISSTVFPYWPKDN